MSSQLSSGRETDLVLVHGWCCHGGFWADVLHALGPGWRAIVPDLRGHGARAGGGGWGIVDFAADVRAALTGADAREPLLVGHSMGAAAVLEAAVLLRIPPERVVLIDPFVFDYGHLDERGIRRLMAPFRRDLARALQVMVGNLLGPRAAPALRQWIAAQMAATPRETALAAFESLLRWDPTPALRRLGGPCPVLATRCSSRAALERHASHIRLTWLEDSGHFPMLEAPEALARWFRRFAPTG